MEEPTTPFKPNDHLANERTYLAWVRTGIGIMAFGFVVVKFSLFVTQIGLALGTEVQTAPHGYSRVIGVALVLFGVCTIVLSFLKYHRTEQQLKSGNYLPSGWLINLLTAVMVLISVLLIVYLLQSIR